MNALKTIQNTVIEWLGGAPWEWYDSALKRESGLRALLQDCHESRHRLESEVKRAEGALAFFMESLGRDEKGNRVVSYSHLNFNTPKLVVLENPLKEVTSIRLSFDDQQIYVIHEREQEDLLRAASTAADQLGHRATQHIKARFGVILHEELEK